ncbi:MAG: Arc family DNA-binding protein [Ruminococcus flavefaciens]|nr:Arc family DNA-binding protein [Ruminococcus flavefaciens]
MDKYQESKNRYLKEKVDELKVRVPKGEKAKIQAFAKSKGKSLNKFILDLIHDAMSK